MKLSILQTKSHEEHYPVYPGEFVLQPKVQALAENLNDRKCAATKPLLNMKETSKSYKIEMAVPGAKRENILVEAEENILSIIILFEKVARYKNLKIREFTPRVYKRHVALPTNADLLFLSAEYREGILKLHVPKSEVPIKNRYTRIAVY
jgi:HSP20 family protein